MPILIYGPSGVGKSTAVTLTTERLRSHRFASLDRMIHDEALRLGYRDLHHLRAERGTDAFLQLGRQLIDAAPEESSLVVDVGAGCLDAHGFDGWLGGVESILISASPEVAYDRIRRGRIEQRSFQQYRAVEFSEKRMSLYSLASYRIDSTKLSETDVALALVDLLIVVAAEAPAPQRADASRRAQSR